MQKLLLDEKAKLVHELSQIGTADPNNPASFTPNVPEMSATEEDASEVAAYGDSLAVAEELKGALKDVNGALSRIEKGIYGICKYCKELIDERRLKARPASASCIACKKQMTREV